MFSFDITRSSCRTEPTQSSSSRTWSTRRTPSRCTISVARAAARRTPRLSCFAKWLARRVLMCSELRSSWAILWRVVCAAMAAFAAFESSFNQTNRPRIWTRELRTLYRLLRKPLAKWATKNLRHMLMPWSSQS